MPDIATVWDVDQCIGDWVITPTGDLQAGQDLVTAALISVFTDAEAGSDDIIVDGSNDPRGWWGGPIGSKLWLLERSKATRTVPALAKAYIQDALTWMIDDGVAARIDVATEWTAPAALGGRIAIYRQDGSNVALNFSRLWEAL